MNKIMKNLSMPNQKGMVLLEGLIAILIFSVGILGAVGLQATMIKANTEAKYRVEAGLIVEQYIAKIWVNQVDMAGWVEQAPGLDVSSRGLPAGHLIAIRGDDENCGGSLSCFVVSVTWKQPGDDMTHNVTSVARITMGGA